MELVDVFVIDLDGTLLQDNGMLASCVRDAIVDLQKQGYQVIIATGRNKREAGSIVEQLKLSHYKSAVILADGQYMYDYTDGTLQIGPFLSFPEDYSRILTGVRGFPGEVRLITAQGSFVMYPSRLRVGYWRCFVKCLLKGRNPYKYVVLGTKKTVTQVEKITVRPGRQPLTVDGCLSEQYEIAFVNDKKRYEFKPKGVNKGDALKAYLQKHNIAAERVAVFGNDENDLCLFRSFPNNFAVDTAAEKVKEQANAIVDHKGGMGVIKTIKRIIKERA